MPVYEARWVPMGVVRCRLGVSRQRVHQYRQEGRLIANKCGNVWMFSGSSVEHLLEELRGRRAVAVKGGDNRGSAG